MASPPREHQSIVGIPIAQATFRQKRNLVLGCWFPKFRRDLRTTMQFRVCMKYTCYMQGPSNRQGGDMWLGKLPSTPYKVYNMRIVLCIFSARYVPELTDVHKLSIGADRHLGTTLLLKWGMLTFVLKGSGWNLGSWFLSGDLGLWIILTLHDSS